MEYIAAHYQMDLALTWAIRLQGKTDQKKFKELGWGLRTWDQWNFNECDERFGDDWPGRIPAQLIAHTLYYFTKPGDLVLDSMAGGGVVPDTCLLFERKCQAFDLAAQDKQGKRPEIEYHHWDPNKEIWPVTKKPDLIFFSPWPIKMQNQQQPWFFSMLTGVILNPHQPQKKNLIKQSQYLTTGFYQKLDGKQSTS